MSITNLLIIISFQLLIILILIYSWYKFGRKTQKTIEEKNRALTKALKEIEIMSRTDHLTALSNRRDIIERIKMEKVRLQRNQNPFALVIIDIDDFKKVNENYGYYTGDYVLRVFSDILKNNIRKQDVATRWGGEEFLLLLPETGMDGANKIAEKIREIIQSTTFEYKKNYIKITITLGVGIVEDFSLNITDIINRVDDAVYKGKKGGKNQVVNI